MVNLEYASASGLIRRFPMARTDSTFPQPDVFSPPDWRWLIACKIHESPKPRHKRRTDPDWLWPLIALAKLASGRKLRGPRIPPSDELVLAFQLYQSRRHQDWELEARILAGQTDEEIAAAMNLPAATVVSAYEETFFSVRSRLEASDYILIEVIGYSPFRGFEEGDLQTLWGYFGMPRDRKSSSWLWLSRSTGGCPTGHSERHLARPPQKDFDSELRRCYLPVPGP